MSVRCQLSLQPAAFPWNAFKLMSRQVLSGHLSSSDRTIVFSKNCQLHWDFLFSLIGFSSRSARVKCWPLSRLTSTLAIPRPPPPQAIPFTVMLWPRGNILEFQQQQHLIVQYWYWGVRDHIVLLQWDGMYYVTCTDVLCVTPLLCAIKTRQKGPKSPSKGQVLKYVKGPNNMRISDP